MVDNLLLYLATEHDFANVAGGHLFGCGYYRILIARNKNYNMTYLSFDIIYLIIPFH